MKKRISIIAIWLTFVCAISACAGKETEVTTTQEVETTTEQESEANIEAATEENIDINLTELSSTVVYSEVYNMMYTPEEYIGKTIKIRGTFNVFQDPDTNQIYFACVVSDATACCAQGIEFVLGGDSVYPEDYPTYGDNITVTGELETYMEGDYRYCRLKDARLG